MIGVGAYRGPLGPPSPPPFIVQWEKGNIKTCPAPLSPSLIPRSLDGGMTRCCVVIVLPRSFQKKGSGNNHYDLELGFSWVWATSPGNLEPSKRNQNI